MHYLRKYFHYQDFNTDYPTLHMSYSYYSYTILCIPAINRGLIAALNDIDMIKSGYSLLRLVRNSVEYPTQPMRNEQLLPTNESHLSSIAAIYRGYIVALHQILLLKWTLNRYRAGINPRD